MSFSYFQTIFSKILVSHSVTFGPPREIRDGRRAGVAVACSPFNTKNATPHLFYVRFYLSDSATEKRDDLV